MINGNRQIIAEYWNAYSPHFDEEHATEDLKLWRTCLQELIGQHENMKTLDIGTGTGFLALMLAELGYESTGIDIASDMLDLGKEHATERNVSVEFIHGEGESLPFDAETFDVVVNARVLWTLLEPKVALTEWKRVLKPGGKVLNFTRLMEPKCEDDNWCYGKEIENQLSLKFATEEELIAVLEQSGYRNVRVIHLPKSLSKAPLNPWICVYGEK